MRYWANTKKSITGNTPVAIMTLVIWLLVAAFASILGVGSTTAQAQSVQQVSTGRDSTCIVQSGWVRCWGSNENGKLGIGKDIGSVKSAPVSVASNREAIAAGPTVCTNSIAGICLSSGPSTPAQPASALAGKYVEKVSVGATHTCALADARVYCWGDNSRGQLGNRSTTTTATPVAVDTQSTDVTPAPVTPSPCGGWTGRSCTPVAQPTQPKSALGGKEVIDIAAAEYFTCALASDGSVACWGEGDNGRLGTNSTSDSNYPRPVFKQDAQPAVAATPGKCVQSLLGRCLRYDPEPTPAKPATPPSPLWNKKAISLARASDGAMCVIAVSASDNTSNRVGYPYCWGVGMGSGSIPQNSTSRSSSEVSNCNPGSSTSTETTYFDSLRPVQNSTAQQFRGIDIDRYATGIGTNDRAYYWGSNGYVATVTKQTSCGDGSGRGGQSKKNNCGGSGKPGCNSKETETTTTTRTYRGIGVASATGPLYNSGTATLNQKPLRVASGDGFSGLFCGTTTSVGTYCDTHGTSANEGQTGSGYTQKCTTTTTLGIFKTTTCEPAPTGPQTVVESGWLSGKTISGLSTGASGYTCALANGSVGCWGLNNKGQLGTGDTANKNVPTAVRL